MRSDTGIEAGARGGTFRYRWVEHRTWELTIVRRFAATLEPNEDHRMLRKLASTGLTVLVVATLAGCSNSEPGLGPKETVEHVAKRLAEGQPVSIWQALPASYQSDVSALLHEFSGKTDRAVWNQSFAVVAKLTRVLREKQRLILEHPWVARQVAASGSTDVEGDWNGIVGLIDLLATSELANLDELRTLDIEAFLSGTGERFMKQVTALSDLAAESLDSVVTDEHTNPIGTDTTDNTDNGDSHFADYLAAAESLQSINVTLVSEEEDRAAVRIEDSGQESRTEKLVRVEGKWIPANLADAWQSQMAKARQSIAKMSSDESKQDGQATMLKLTMADGILDSLLAAETGEQFNSAIGAATGAVLGLAIQASLAQGTQPTGDEPTLGSGASITFSDASDPMRSEQPRGDTDSGLANLPTSPATIPVESDNPPETQAIETSMNSQPSESYDGPDIPMAEVDRFVGRKLRIVAADGLDLVATLAHTEGDMFTFEQPLSTGAMSFKMHRNEIKSLRAAR
jgi:hypothetical protein